MPDIITATTLDRLWDNAVDAVLYDGRPVNPRGQATFELTHAQLRLELPALTC